MDTPIVNFLTEYSNTHQVRPHMPGHKGRSPLADSRFKSMYAFDITEIEGADSLYESNGIIAKSEKNASELFGTKATYYSCSGSTLCIQAMLFMMKQEGRKIFAMRNVHRSFLNACCLLNLEVEWVYPKKYEGILSGMVPLGELEYLLSHNKKPAAVYITSPDYLGNMADIGAVSKLCKKYNAVLIVDNAHGAHLAFTPINMHPIALGADMCCDSAHKMLPALTGAAYLHIGNERYIKKAKHAMSVFGTTSPSYLILSSLDLCNLYLAQNIREDIVRVQNEIHRMHSALSEYFRFSYGDTFHMTIHAKESGCTGLQIVKFLKKDNIEPEYYDRDIVVLLFSPVTDASSVRVITASLLEAARTLDCHAKKISKNDGIGPCKLESVMPMQEAFFADYEEIPVDNAEGRVCAGVHVPCPPAIPIAVSGEMINKECINIFKYYNIQTVDVVKKSRENPVDNTEDTVIKL